MWSWPFSSHTGYFTYHDMNIWDMVLIERSNFYCWSKFWKSSQLLEGRCCWVFPTVRHVLLCRNAMMYKICDDTLLSVTVFRWIREPSSDWGYQLTCRLHIHRFQYIHICLEKIKWIFTLIRKNYFTEKFWWFFHISMMWKP